MQGTLVQSLIQEGLHAAEELSLQVTAIEPALQGPGTTATEPTRVAPGVHTPESGLCNKRSPEKAAQQ